MQKYLYTLIFLLCNMSCNGIQKDLIPYRKGIKWGFVDKNKKIVIPCQYDDVEPFVDQLAKVKLAENYGLINKEGQVMVPIEYNSIVIVNELIIVEKKELKGVLNINGNTILPIQYRKIEIDEQSHIFAELDYKNEQVFDKKGNPIIYKKINQQGVLVVLDSKTNKYALEKQNKQVTPYKYDEIGELSHGLLSFKVDRQWGFVDTTGKEVIPPQYDLVNPFKANMACVCKNGQCGIIDKQGKEIIPFQYKNALIVNTNTFAIQTHEGKWGLMDAKKNMIQTPKYDDVNLKSNDYLEVFMEKNISFLQNYDNISDFKNGIAIVTLKGKKGIVAENEKEIVPCIYDDIQNFQEDRAWVMQNNKWGLIDTKGKLIIPCKYQEAISFSEGLASVKMNHQWGFVDIHGKEVIKCQYDLVGTFTNGITIAISNGKASFINKKGEIQTNISDEGIEIEATLELPDEPFISYNIPKKIRKKLGYIDSKGTEYWENE